MLLYWQEFNLIMRKFKYKQNLFHPNFRDNRRLAFFTLCSAKLTAWFLGPQKFAEEHQIPYFIFLVPRDYHVKQAAGLLFLKATT